MRQQYQSSSWSPSISLLRTLFRCQGVLALHVADLADALAPRAVLGRQRVSGYPPYQRRTEVTWFDTFDNPLGGNEIAVTASIPLCRNV
jgi:hypothetical protein